jgi:hypothetical protein
VSITKVAGFFTTYPTKLSCIFLNFIRFDREFTRFSKLEILLKFQLCGQTPETLRFLQKYPRFALRPSGRIGTLHCGPRAPADGGPAKFRRTGGRDWPGAGGRWPERSLGSISAEVWSGGGAGGVTRQRGRWPGLAAVPPYSGDVEPQQRLRASGELRWG